MVSPDSVQALNAGGSHGGPRSPPATQSTRCSRTVALQFAAVWTGRDTERRDRRPSTSGRISRTLVICCLKPETPVGVRVVSPEPTARASQNFRDYRPNGSTQFRFVTWPKLANLDTAKPFLLQPLGQCLGSARQRRKRAEVHGDHHLGLQQFNGLDGLLG